jgi:hypothetical protein
MMKSISANDSLRGLFGDGFAAVVFLRDLIVDPLGNVESKSRRCDDAYSDKMPFFGAITIALLLRSDRADRYCVRPNNATRRQFQARKRR